MHTKPLVAIVDDDSSTRATIKDLLESAGFSATTFSSSERFLTSKRRKAARCLVADMRMPGMSGLELHRRLMSMNRGIPTILITAYPEARLQTEALKSGVVCFLVKPFIAEDLLACVRTALKRRDDKAE
ncbi:MAG TPA: response regulator [Gammaproteobacteria bacterium]|nr:response regulator [Gammaproteobacteria bacterium]